MDVTRLACESCGGEILAEDEDDFRCRGCTRYVCSECVNVFGHFDDGPHGTGDPWNEMRDLRTRAEQVEARLENVRNELGAVLRKLEERDAEPPRD